MMVQYRVWSKNTLASMPSALLPRTHELKTHIVKCKQYSGSFDTAREISSVSITYTHYVQ